MELYNIIVLYVIIGLLIFGMITLFYGIKTILSFKKLEKEFEELEGSDNE